MKFFLPLFLFSFIICSPAMADQKIVFVDMDRLVSVSKPGSSIFKQLKDINNKNLNFLKNEEKKCNTCSDPGHFAHPIFFSEQGCRNQ